jgi:hypothetical protein
MKKHEFLELKAKFTREMEREFEALMEEYPFVVQLPECERLAKSKGSEAMLAYDQTVVEWLGNNMSHRDLYIAFPSAGGKYAGECNSVRFRHKSDALWFKLAVL